MKNRISWGVWAIRCVVVAVCCVRGVMAGNGQSSERHRPACQIEQFRFVGNDADRVGTGRQDSPNGVPDGHLQLTLSAPTGVAIKSFMITLASGGRWSYPEPHSWMIGLYTEGQKIAPHPEGIIVQFEGEKLLDLYIEPIASRFFGSGDEFQIALHLENNTMLVSHCQVLWESLAK
jgi:hypothetical protein